MKTEPKHEIRDFVVGQMECLASRPNIVEEIECALPVGDEGREMDVLQVMVACTK